MSDVEDSAKAISIVSPTIVATNEPGVAGAAVGILLPKTFTTLPDASVPNMYVGVPVLFVES